MHLQRVGLAVVAFVPHLFVNARAAQNFAGVTQEKDEQRLLFRSQIESPPGPFRTLGRQVNLQILIRQNCGRLPGGCGLAHAHGQEVPRKRMAYRGNGWLRSRPRTRSETASLAVKNRTGVT